MSTFTPPSFAALSTFPATYCAKFFMCDVQKFKKSFCLLGGRANCYYCILTTDHIQTTAAIGNDPSVRICPFPFFEATPPGAAPDTRLKPGPVFVASGDVINDKT